MVCTQVNVVRTWKFTAPVLQAPKPSARAARKPKGVVQLRDIPSHFASIEGGSSAQQESTHHANDRGVAPAGASDSAEEAPSAPSSPLCSASEQLDVATAARQQWLSMRTASGSALLASALQHAHASPPPRFTVPLPINAPLRSSQCIASSMERWQVLGHTRTVTHRNSSGVVSSGEVAEEVVAQA